ncbi:hypothetical protein PMKS-001990 [Pichia membranifaciens]|uniref:Mannosyltransferase n=1 Tax=Pichia membranifaciens TaxID=4926 RepID=A0A1Q2YG51_9ASCO|nr:hypothetical protein PMKS-001990 [Pichia membranifaciens]
MVLLAPYTKVEESFNVQALHDFINVGVDEIMLFDHVTFPGSVKRTDGNALISIREAIVSVGVSGLMSIFLCSRVDSYFWDVNFIIPEFESFVFNVIGGNSSDWGVESPVAYFTRYLPKLFGSEFGVVLILSLVFFILSIINLKMFYCKNKRYRIEVDYVNYGVGTITTLMWTALIYIGVLSINGHKEWRFLIYTIPILCVGAASTAEWLMSKSKILKRIMITIMVFCYIFSLASSFLFGYISSWNYSGGDACQKLNLRLIDIYGSNHGTMLKPLIVHWDVGTCMNGGSLFTQISDNKVSGDGWLEEQGGREPRFWVIYDKNEDSEVLTEIADDFDYWIQYDDEEMIPLSEGYQWLLVDVSEGFKGIDFKFLVDTLKNPREIGLQLLYAFESGNMSWFKNVADSVILKEIRGRIWERSAADKVLGGI